MKKVIIGAAIFVAIIGLMTAMTSRSLTIKSPQTITVSATAKKEESNQIAQFYAGVTAANTDKQAAINEVNQKMEEVITKVKEFGIDPADIKTQNMSVYQDQEQITIDGRQTFQPGQWRVNNSVQIKLRDVTKASDLISLLGGSGLTDISGPNFTVDEDLQSNQGELLQQAVEKAREKATVVAEANGKKITKIVNITEGSSANYGPMFDRAQSGGGGGVPIEVGTSTVQATVTVVFEIR